MLNHFTNNFQPLCFQEEQSTGSRGSRQHKVSDTLFLHSNTLLANPSFGMFLSISKTFPEPQLSKVHSERQNFNFCTALFSQKLYVLRSGITEEFFFNSLHMVMNMISPYIEDHALKMRWVQIFTFQTFLFYLLQSFGAKMDPPLYNHGCVHHLNLDLLWISMEVNSFHSLPFLVWKFTELILCDTHKCQVRTKEVSLPTDSLWSTTTWVKVVSTVMTHADFTGIYQHACPGHLEVNCLTSLTTL